MYSSPEASVINSLGKLFHSKRTPSVFLGKLKAEDPAITGFARAGPKGHFILSPQSPLICNVHFSRPMKGRRDIYSSVRRGRK